MESSSISTILRSWVPVRVGHHSDLSVCRWLYTGDHNYADPFFDETISRCLSYNENSHRCKTITTLLTMQDWSRHIDAIIPSALIFHVSRCGSTLVSQALGLKDGAVSLSEVPIFDQLLRLPLLTSTISESLSDQLLFAAIRYYGARRMGTERYLFVKLDSWHLMYYNRLRNLFPGIPFFVQYREPGAVLESNRRKMGIQGIAEIIGPEVYRFSSLGEDSLHPDTYMPAVLQRMFEELISASESDNNLILLNYNEGLTAIVNKIAQVCNIVLFPAEELRMNARGAFHSKHPSEKFVERNIGLNAHPRLSELYYEAERIRNRVSPSGSSL
jgi:hypothetical protein